MVLTISLNPADYKITTKLRQNRFGLVGLVLVGFFVRLGLVGLVGFDRSYV